MMRDGSRGVGAASVQETVVALRCVEESISSTANNGTNIDRNNGSNSSKSSINRSRHQMHLIGLRLLRSTIDMMRQEKENLADSMNALNVRSISKDDEKESDRTFRTEDEKNCSTLKQELHVQKKMLELNLWLLAAIAADLMLVPHMQKAHTDPAQFLVHTQMYSRQGDGGGLSAVKRRLRLTAFDESDDVNGKARSTGNDPVTWSSPHTAEVASISTDSTSTASATEVAQFRWRLTEGLLG